MLWCLWFPTVGANTGIQCFSLVDFITAALLICICICVCICICMSNAAGLVYGVIVMNMNRAVPQVAEQRGDRRAPLPVG